MSAPWNNKDRDRDRDRSRDDRRPASGSRWNAVTSSWSKAEGDKQGSRWQAQGDKWKDDIDHQLERFQSAQSDQWSTDKKGAAWSKESGGWVPTKKDERDWKTSTHSSRSVMLLTEAKLRRQVVLLHQAIMKQIYELHGLIQSIPVIQPRMLFNLKWCRKCHLSVVHPIHPRKRL